MTTFSSQCLGKGPISRYKFNIDVDGQDAVVSTQCSGMPGEARHNDDSGIGLVTSEYLKSVLGTRLIGRKDGSWLIDPHSSEKPFFEALPATDNTIRPKRSLFRSRSHSGFCTTSGTDCSRGASRRAITLRSDPVTCITRTTFTIDG